jgi:hypothetical protein
MTYAEAIAAFPHDEVYIQIDDTVRLMTPEEYETFIKKQVDYQPLA